MAYPDRRHRQSIRLRDYDYSRAGAYFVTMCTHERLLYFEDAGVRAIAEQCWDEIPAHHPHVTLDEWIVMPNHLHGVLVFNGDGGESKEPGMAQERGGGQGGVRHEGVQLNAPTAGAAEISPRRGTLSVVIRTYKAAVTTLCRAQGSNHFGWQRGYYDRVIRNERELQGIRQYIVDNPVKWELDENHPDRLHATP